MISFLNSERREFLPQFDVLVVGTFFGAQMSRRPTKRSSLFIDIPEQTKMTLKADIKYKSNWQQGALKCAFFLSAVCTRPVLTRILAKRRNKWICALKLSLAKVKIFGPGGDPDAKAGPTPYTLVPYTPERDQPQRKDTSGTLTEPRIPEAWTFSDHNAVMCMYFPLCPSAKPTHILS